MKTHAVAAGALVIAGALAGGAFLSGKAYIGKVRETLKKIESELNEAKKVEIAAKAALDTSLEELGTSRDENRKYLTAVTTSLNELKEVLTRSIEEKNTETLQVQKTMADLTRSLMEFRETFPKTVEENTRGSADAIGRLLSDLEQSLRKTMEVESQESRNDRNAMNASISRALGEIRESTSKIVEDKTRDTLGAVKFLLTELRGSLRKTMEDKHRKTLTTLRRSLEELRKVHPNTNSRLEKHLKAANNALRYLGLRVRKSLKKSSFAKREAENRKGVPFRLKQRMSADLSEKGYSKANEQPLSAQRVQNSSEAVQQHSDAPKLWQRTGHSMYTPRQDQNPRVGHSMSTDGQVQKLQVPRLPIAQNGPEVFAMDTQRGDKVHRPRDGQRSYNNGILHEEDGGGSASDTSASLSDSSDEESEAENAFFPMVMQLSDANGYGPSETGRRRYRVEPPYVSASDPSRGSGG
jgi:hypothetical protein